MKIIGVIPARFGSTRFPGKPLTPILNKPMLQWTIEAVQKTDCLQDVIVATDHEEIFKLAEKCKAKAVMTASDLPTGTDRVWHAVKEIDCDVVINIQGDEPLIESEVIEKLAKAFDDPNINMATLGRSIQTEKDLLSDTTAKIVLNENNEAIYFSRFPIPYSRIKSSDELGDACLKHIGIYAYRKSFLEKFCKSEESLIEKAEGLEQLRALYIGGKIKVIKVENDSWGVDKPEDVNFVEQKLSRRNS